MTRAAIAVVGIVVAGCTLFESDIPDRSCRNDDDCFRAQGERCDQGTMACVAGETADAPPALPDAPPPPDANVDATVAP